MIENRTHCKEAASVAHLDKPYWAIDYMACQFPRGCAFDTKFGQQGKIAFNLDKTPERCMPMLGRSVCRRVNP